MIRTRRTPGRVINHSSARGRRTDQDLLSVPAMNLSPPGPEGTAVVLLVRQGQGLTVQEDRDLMVREDRGPTVRVQARRTQDQDLTVRAQARRTPARGLTVRVQVPAPTAQLQDLMVREDRDLMVLRRVSSVPRVQKLRRVLALVRASSVR